MTRADLIQWIKENDTQYLHTNLSFLSDEELLKLKKFIEDSKEQLVKSK